MNFRGALLMVLALLWALMGFHSWEGLLSPDAVCGLGLWHVMLGPRLQSFLWVSAAAAAALAARVPSLGACALTLLAVMPAIRFSSYSWSWLMYLIPGAPPGYQDGWFYAAFYGSLMLLVLLAARLPGRHK